MKAKTARRRLRSLEWKMAKARLQGWVSSYSGIGKKWKYYTREGLK